MSIKHMQAIQRPLQHLCFNDHLPCTSALDISFLFQRASWNRSYVGKRHIGLLFLLAKQLCQQPPITHPSTDIHSSPHPLYTHHWTPETQPSTDIHSSPRPLFIHHWTPETQPSTDIHSSPRPLFTHRRTPETHPSTDIHSCRPVQ